MVCAPKGIKRMTSTAPAIDVSSSTATYYDQINIYEYDETIVTHAYMDQIKASIISELILLDSIGQKTISILDGGTGSGQLARCIIGAGFSRLELADIDWHAKDFCLNNPELSGLPFHHVDLCTRDLEMKKKQFDVICLLGVYHHIAPECRVSMLRNLSKITHYIVIGDEGIQEYSCEDERVRNARIWYGFVIGDARRRGLNKLAEFEEQFLASDTAPKRKPEDDFKESPTAVINAAQTAGLFLLRTRRLGDWSKHKGGMYNAVFAAGKR